MADHIFDKMGPEMEALGLECECLGGGKMEHNSQDKNIRVFGESTVSLLWWKINGELWFCKSVCFNVCFFVHLQAFGKADHSVSVEKLKTVFSGYEITWADDNKWLWFLMWN